MVASTARTIGTYEILNLIGRGGLGDVYLARVRNLERYVALKQFTALQFASHKTVERFVSGVHKASGLDHPNLVTMYDCFESEAIPCIAMEYLPGGPLRPYMTSMSLVQLVGVIEGVLSALAHAEARGFMHGSLTPENVFVADDGRVKVADLESSQALMAIEAEMRLTPLMATTVYLAPEQASGGRLGPWTHLYAVGVIAYEQVTGSCPPVSMWGPRGLLLREPAETRISPAREINPQVDPGISSWIDRLLQPDPSQRPQSAQGAWDELDDILSDLFGSRWRHEAGLAPMAHSRSIGTEPGRPIHERIDADAFEASSDRRVAHGRRSDASIVVLDSIEVPHPNGARRIDLCRGDLTAVPRSEEVDVLVVSAFPGSYFPAPGTLISALSARGISIGRLAQDKAVDLRATCSCWLSREIDEAATVGFKQILCFEPFTRGAPPEVVGDIFRSLLPFLGENGVRVVAMPVVSSGNVGVPVSAMLPPLVEAAVNWMALGVSLERLLIYVSPRASAREEAQRLFADIKREISADSATERAFKYDLFVSYAHEDESDVSFITDELQRTHPGLALYLDRIRLDPGSAWQHEIFDALDASRKVLALYSPAYVASKVCKEEFNIAWARGRDSDASVLFPLYLYTAPLPTYMKMLHYADCREGSRDRLKAACSRLGTVLTG